VDHDEAAAEVGGRAMEKWAWDMVEEMLKQRGRVEYVSDCSASTTFTH
jgi:hypothetical protein